MELNRKKFQGVSNIVRFNWHFYVITSIALIIATIVNFKFFGGLQSFGFRLILGGALPIVISLIVSFYIYDLSSLYLLKWLPNFDNKSVLNINAGFDETTSIIQMKSTNCQLTICDFYNPTKHTEISIKRARKIYPPHKGTIQVSTTHLPFSDNSFDFSLAILSAHEIRDEVERVKFFMELNRITKQNGQIIITEHLRDLNNFLAYTIGFLHFYSQKSWLKTFKEANLILKQEIKTTPFITTFILESNGNPL